ncbi:MAG: carbohydrate deacetylase [Planctomycetaceae bacterium]
MILVVNADDAGVDRARNEGILDAARRGVVRSASLLVGFPAAAEFAERARRLEGLGVGLHANFTEGVPLVKGHATLAGRDGRFLGKEELLRRARAGLLDTREARRELEAQLERCASFGLKPTHVDGHNHAHLHPGIAEALLAVVPPGAWVRVPGRDATCPAPLQHIPELAARAEALGFSRYRRADCVTGLDLREGYGVPDLLALLAQARGGIVELVTHPGGCDSASVAFSALAGRERERATLCDPALIHALSARGIGLANFRDVSGASQGGCAPRRAAGE